jgi:hypothetical protein
MVILPAYVLILATLLHAQQQPEQPRRGPPQVDAQRPGPGKRPGPDQRPGGQPPGLPPAGSLPGNALTTQRSPFVPGDPLWFATQLPIWLVLFMGVRRRQQARAQHCQMLADEEETKTPYSQEDLMQDHEFKIVRNELNLFEQPELLAEALREEAQAGWQLVEKFDGNRMRLKRPVSQRASDAALPAGFDPYRTAVLPAATKKALAEKRLKEMKIAGWALAGCVSLGVFCGLAATATNEPDFMRFIFILTAVCAGIGAVISAIVLIVRFFSQ